jgi:hypothetical protein
VARQDDVHGAQEVVVDALGQRLYGRGFDIEHFARQFQRARCGGNGFVHGAEL